MGTLTITGVFVDGTPYGTIGSGTGNQAASSVRVVTFGAYLPSGEAHFDLRNIVVTSGGLTLFGPPLISSADFDGVTDTSVGGTMGFAGGVMSIDLTSGDLFGWKDLGADYTDIAVHFEVRRRAGDTNPDYHDIGPLSNSGVTELFDDGIYTNGTGWCADDAFSPCWASTGVSDDTWYALDVEWSYLGGPPVPGNALHVHAKMHSS